MIKVNDCVAVKTDGGARRNGRVLTVEEFNEGVMYLVALEEYPQGVWFFNETNQKEGTFVELINHES